MLLSIFPQAAPLPKSKEEKSKEAKYFSRPYLPEVVEVDTDEALLQVVTSFAWSPFIFKQARLKDDFVSTDFLVLDIDDGLKLADAEERIVEAGYACLAVPTTSHTPEKHRYRLIFPLSRTITKVEEFEASILDLMEAFPESDPACKDYARAFYGSTQDDGFWLDGMLLAPTEVAPPVKNKYDRPDTSESVKVDLSIAEIVKELYAEEREFIPEAVDYFINNGKSGLPGLWNSSLNRCAFTLGLQNVSLEAVEDLVAFIAPYPLDKNDMFTINRSWKQGNEARELG